MPKLVGLYEYRFVEAVLPGDKQIDRPDLVMAYYRRFEGLLADALKKGDHYGAERIQSWMPSDKKKFLVLRKVS